jgi:hypothetical protein
VSDREAASRLLLQAEVNALTVLLIAKGVVTQAEWTALVEEEVERELEAWARRQQLDQEREGVYR